MNDIEVNTNQENNTISEENNITSDITNKESTVTSNAIQTEEYSINTYKDGSYSISLPSINLLNFNSKLKEFNQLNLDENDSKLKKWREVAEDSINYYTVGSLYQDRFTDSKSSFKQGIETKDNNLNSISPLKFKKTEGELRGEIALLKVSKMLGLGDIINIPLPHSGIWITIKPPTEKDLIDFYNSIFKEKIILGRATFGLTLTNFSVYINNRLFDFILKHIHSINYSNLPKDDLKKYVLIHDFPILAWGFATAIYPNGFEYQRACVNDIEACPYVAKATLNMSKLLWVDNSSLTEAQKNILEEFRPNKLTLDNYNKFISEHTRISGSTFTINDNIKIRLKVPTFDEYTTDGLSWINSINSAIENVILKEDSSKEEETRIELLNQYVKTSILRQFNHFIDYIEIDDNVINDRETINKVLEVFSSDDTIRTEITNNVLKFKSNTTIALIGIPEYTCPECNSKQNTTPINDKFVNVIPLDTMNLFFTLITLRVSKILEREV